MLLDSRGKPWLNNLKKEEDTMAKKKEKKKEKKKGKKGKKGKKKK